MYMHACTYVASVNDLLACSGQAELGGMSCCDATSLFLYSATESKEVVQQLPAGLQAFLTRLQKLHAILHKVPVQLWGVYTKHPGQTQPACPPTHAQGCSTSHPIRLQCYLELMMGRQRMRALQCMLSMPAIHLVFTAEHTASLESPERLAQLQDHGRALGRRMR